ncbi:MAG TPA: 2-C-methyl-D-erythritol 4-phosphate cytidylyltransferase [Candidatus Anaerobiospirillum stercoravium]|nr:2-C-methyl-D-erythritol 4-phosphate cytidylyltransferase [Candidatus Anaerobiospirillum stercoravium]
MYVEIKTPASGRKYVYLKRSVRVNGRVKHITVERFGELNDLLAQDPDFIIKLNEKCRAGSPDLFSSKLHAFEHNLTAALHNAVSTSAAVATPEGSIPPKSKVLGEPKCGVTPTSSGAAVATQGQAATAPSISLLFATAPTSLKDAELNELFAVYAPRDAALPEKGVLGYIQEHGLVDVVVPAAGVGARMGAEVPKQYLKLDDKCVLEHTVLKLLTSPFVHNVIVALSPDDPYFKYTCLVDLKRVIRVNGGSERVDSVLAGLKATRSSWVMVHDAARPLISLTDIEQLLLKVARTQLTPEDSPLPRTEAYCGGILVAPMADTVKQAQSIHGGELHAIDRTLNRAHLWRALTPQLFGRTELMAAIEQGLSDRRAITDEASALERLGKKVLMVEGSPLNFKLTQPSDLLLTKALLSYLAPHC